MIPDPPDIRIDAFYPSYYLSLYPDVMEDTRGDSGRAREHFMARGIHEGRSANPFFDPQDYLRRYPDLTDRLGPRAYPAALLHWLDCGVQEGRRGSPVFHLAHYLHAHPDLYASYGPRNYRDAFDHWARNGHSEGRTTSAEGLILRICPHESGFFFVDLGDRRNLRFFTHPPIPAARFLRFYDAYAPLRRVLCITLSVRLDITLVLSPEVFPGQEPGISLRHFLHRVKGRQPFRS
jgi:hypothetical protein